MKQDVNVVVITGNLTRDPELRTTQGGTSVCELRVAVNSRRKNASGEWIDKPNFFNVTTFGSQAENHAEYLGKGRPVAVEGRLDWSEWETEGGSKRQAVKIIANSVQYLPSGKRGEEAENEEEAPESEGAELAGVGAGGEDDIPF